MNQRIALLQTIKRELKAQGLTYKDIAGQLALSENSIKRLFSEQNTSLERLERLCDIAGLTLAELVKKMEIADRHIEQLTLAQEQMIVSDVKLLLVSVCVLHHWQFDDIIRHYQMTETECIQLLATLDRLQIIALQPLNRIRLTVAKHFRWRDKGPVQQYFQKYVQQDFFQSNFTQAGDTLLFSTGMLSRASHQHIDQRMATLINEFNELNNNDSVLPLDERFGSSLVVAKRAWEFTAFGALRRVPNDKRL